MEHLKEKLKQLRLLTLAQSLESRNQYALGQQISYLDFLELLLEDEWSARQSQAYQKRLSSSKLSAHKQLDNYDFSYQPELDKRLVYELAACRFVAEKKNLVLMGNPGVGKTHLANAIGLEALKKGYKVLFTHANEVIDKLHTSRADGTYRTALNKILSPDLLIIDELGFKEAIEFQVVDTATRFKRVNYEEFEERRKSPFLNSIPYSTTASKGLDLFAFRQLKVSALKPDSEMYVEDTSEKYRSKVPFHSIKDLVQYEVSRCSTLYRFINRFITYIEALGVSAELKTPGMRSVEEVDELNLAIPDDFKISVVDGRKNPEPPIDEIVSSLRKTSFRHYISPIAKRKHELCTGDVALYVMDYNDSDLNPDNPYALLAGEEDGYRMFKQDLDFASIPKQGLRINQKCYRRKAQEEKAQRSTERTLSPLRREDYLSYEPLNATDMDRNLSICVKQLFLKAVTLRPHLASALPLCQELTNTMFLNWQKQKKTYQIGYFTDGQFFAHQYEPRQIIEGLAPIIYKYTGRHFKDILRALAKYHHHAQDPNAIDSLGNFKLIISPEFVWEIQDMEERYLYDEDKVHKNLKEKEKKRPRRAFLAKMVPNAANPHLVQQYNEYILTNVKEAELSFRDLIRKYGKDDDESGRTGFLKSVFGVRVTSPSVLKFFNTCCNIPVGSEKPNDVFKLHKGIWLAPQEMQYFVGRKSGYKDYEQEKGFGMRKIIPHAGAFDGTLFFSMLKVDFIRHREYTVYPFPYKLIDIAMEMNNSLT